MITQISPDNAHLFALAAIFFVMIPVLVLALTFRAARKAGQDWSKATDWRCTRCGSMKSQVVAMSATCRAGPSEACPLEPVFN